MRPNQVLQIRPQQTKKTSKKLKNNYLNLNTGKEFTKQQIIWRSKTRTWSNSSPHWRRRLRPWVARKGFQLMVEKKTSSNDSQRDFSESMDWLAVASKATTTNSNLWWSIDSGTTNALVPNTTSLISSTQSTLVRQTARNEKITATVKGKFAVSGLPNVTAHHIKGLAGTLLSVSVINDHNVGVVFLKDKVLFVNQTIELEEFLSESKSVISQVSRVKQSYYLDTLEVSSYCALKIHATNMLTCHLSFWHLILRGIQHVQRRKEIEVSKDNSQLVMECEDFIKGNFNYLNMESQTLNCVSRKLDCVHFNMCQLPIKSHSGSCYMMSFIDEYTNMGVLLWKKSEDQSFSCVKN